MLRGTHLLQTIRVCSQIYLHTECASNKTTAKAALQQLVVTVFVRLERSIERGKLEDKIGIPIASGGNETKEARKRANSASSTANPTFPTQDHRDAYLVLRSLCKLSMQTSMVRVAPAPIVLTSGPAGASGRGGDTPAAPPPVVPPTPTSSQHDVNLYDPALESRILALQLLLHI